MTIELSLPKKFNTFCIREWTLDDAEALADIEYDDKIKEHFNIPTLPKHQFISEFVPDIARGWAIESTTTETVVGTIDCYKYHQDNKKMELRIFITPEFQGQGIGTEAVKYFINCIFNAVWVKGIVAVVHPDNAGSKALIYKVGFSLIGEASDGINELFELNKT